MNFDSEISGIENGNSVSVEAVLREGSTTDKALYVEKDAGSSGNVIISAGTGVQNANELTFEFDFNLAEANSGTVAQIFFDKALYGSPMDVVIVADSAGYRFGALSGWSAGNRGYFGTETLSFGKYYHVKLHVVVGDADSFVATLYIDGTEVGSTNIFLNPEKAADYQPAGKVNSVVFGWQEAASLKAYIDNLSLSVK